MLCKVLKLNTGESVIGNITEESRGYVEVHRPLRVLVQPTSSGTFGVALVRWEPISDFETPARIFKHSIVSVTDPSDEFRENYLEIYEKYDSKNFDVVDKTEKDDTSENLSKLEEMIKDMMQSNTKHTFH